MHMNHSGNCDDDNVQDMTDGDFDSYEDDRSTDMRTPNSDTTRTIFLSTLSVHPSNSPSNPKLNSLLIGDHHLSSPWQLGLGWMVSDDEFKAWANDTILR